MGLTAYRKCRSRRVLQTRNCFFCHYLSSSDWKVDHFTIAMQKYTPISYVTNHKHKLLKNLKFLNYEFYYIVFLLVYPFHSWQQRSRSILQDDERRFEPTTNTYKLKTPTKRYFLQSQYHLRTLVSNLNQAAVLGLVTK